ncbi:Histidine kinase-, DNA gyrase B-, and HSP90-like ATPase [Pricia antarctica]|uniref:histidine kinase n=1 Tax=Pricia antarctica TaxID=641691 RepID=A0A1G7FEF9_9FLAO|nr:tetratricopeptide repeat-containing sensor histidine kinase [Pricia antarctica]SDE74311.1 Histidine kinase-, DNA gyrase B-, and HSP90-like ATPase [Pricia antarctica]
MNIVKTYFLTLSSLLKKHLLILGVALFVPIQNNAQQNVKDSLKEQLHIKRSQPRFTTKDTLYIDLINALGNEMRFYNSDSLFKLSNQALELSKSSDYKLGENKALLGLGDYYSDKGAHKKGITYYKKALSLGKTTKNQELILKSQNNLAGEYGYKGDYAKALIGYLEGIDLAKAYGDSLMLSVMSENIANLYISQKDYVQALEFYKIVKKINQEIGNEIYSAETMSNIASLYADMGQLDYAMYNVNSSITVFEKLEIMDWLAFAYQVKGKTYLKENKFKWAIYWYSQSEMLHKNLDDDRGRIDLLNGMAEAYFGLKQDDISERYALEAFEVSDKLQFMEGKQKCAKTLYKIHKNKKNFAASLEYHELYQRLSDSLSSNENKKSLTLLETKMEHQKQKQDLIEVNRKQLAQQRNYVNAALAILLIFVVITFLVRRSEKIQKNLNTELKGKTTDLEKSEQELRDINRTKDKLFSIIGHDLRGPIGAFQGLLKLFKEGDISQSEFMEYIPKLRHDIDHISFTLNNLLTWGHTQMNGAVTKPSVVGLESIVKDNIHLLSEIAQNKSIKLVSQIPTNTLVWSDSDQIDIVIRNLISNALKFTPKNGMVTISAQEKGQYWQVSIRDTGIGMDAKTIERIFALNSNHTTYGTNNEKGTGLGLSLCKEMVEKNGGSIWAESLLRKGSTFHFTVPRAKKSYRKTG